MGSPHCPAPGEAAQTWSWNSTERGQRCRAVKPLRQEKGEVTVAPSSPGNKNTRVAFQFWIIFILQFIKSFSQCVCSIKLPFLRANCCGL